MNREAANRVANAVLYEGYILYPYRPSVKNRQRWTFGGLYPEEHCRAQHGSDAADNRTECLVRGAGSVVSVLEKGDFFSEARQAWQCALELEPQHIPAHLALGRFLVMTAYRNGGTPTPGMAR